MEPTQATGANEPHDERSIDTSTVSYTPITGQIGRDTLYEALSNARRRHVIRALEDGPKDIGALSRAIAAVENDTTVEEVSSDERKRVYVSLYQVHLQNLDDWDIVEWDATSQIVRPGSAHETALEAMQAVAESGSEPEPASTGLLDYIRGIIGGGA